ncbi:hypothetical protein GGX14DRAFT_442296 [Mycena pura]|uniref:phytol kinase n=1 Tax=Mycena pura TaxID=153505 RepID=A0AAD6VLT6_9AGAR|nr:hypothetical protein GGX14DRAFT_442296 [Mycena pura]
MKFNEELTARQLSPEDLDPKVTFCLQYLKASDIPPLDHGCCSHVLGFYHAHVALRSLANISYLARPALDSQFVTRLLDAWPDIWKWLEYTFDNWVVSPMFDLNNSTRFHAFQMVVIALRSFIKLPPCCELILSNEGGKKAFVMLGSCWLYEFEDEFKTASNDDHLLSAAEPLLDLGTFKPGPPPDMFFGCILSSTRDTSRPARVALHHLAWYVTSPAPWDPQALFLLDYHLRMASTISVAPQYLDALLAQHSVRTVTRILVSLASTPYDDATATGAAQAIAAGLAFLNTVLPAADGFAWTTHAVQIGLLPALLRAHAWLDDLPEDREGSTTLVELLRLLSLYSLYPSLLRVLVHSVNRVRELNLPDIIKDDAPVMAAYQELEDLVHERSALMETDLEICCQNPSCRKTDAQNNFSSCSGCFTTAYCSTDCQKAHWKNGHRDDCKALKELREDGRAPPISAEDYDSACKLVIEEVRKRKGDITPVWRAEPPAPGRAPALSLNYFLDDPRGVLVVGAPDVHPPQGYAEFASVRATWDDVLAQEIHREHIIVGAYLPHGSTGKLHFMWMGINDRLPPSEGSIAERLIRTVEMM